MFDIGFTEMLVIAIIGMVVIGPERLPGAARTVGRNVGKLRRFLSNLQNQLEQEVKLDELNRKIMEETKGQTFRNNNEKADEPGSAKAGQPEPAADPHRKVDAEVPGSPPKQGERSVEPADAHPTSSTQPSKSEETTEKDEVRKS